MSVSSLNRHFRAVTAMSPGAVSEAVPPPAGPDPAHRGPDDVAAIGYNVGYDSPSQFSREYRRMFGVPPGRDAARLQNVKLQPV
jgi:AraC-like DNA-binding protein